MHRIARLPLAATPSTSRLFRTRALAALCAGAVLGAGMTATAPAQAADPGWGPVQQIPPDGVHELPRTGVFPDGTLVAVWEDDDTGDQDDLTRIFRSTRAPGADWSAPVAFPVEDVWNLESIATLSDGGIQIAYGWHPSSSAIKHRVRIWNADGTVEAVGLGNTSDDYTLNGDAEGDVVAELLGSYDTQDGFDHLLRYYDGTAWRGMPNVAADPRDRFVTGPGESVWMAGYDQSTSKLRVRSWAPEMKSWKLEWSRDYPSGHLRKPLVDALALAVGAAGHVTLAWAEREIGRTGDTIRVVRREGRSGWTKPATLQRVPAGRHKVITGPVVAAAGTRSEVAWTVPGKKAEWRVVRVAALAGDGPDVRRLASTRSFSGFRDLSLDVDLRGDGDALVSYLKRRGSRRQVVGWFGAPDALQGTTLLKNAGIMIGDSAFLVPGVAAVISSVGYYALASRVLEE
ncbi:hypothetical protein BH09ACT12_BH09ACT12_16550 [soil metagenome]